MKKNVASQKVGAQLVSATDGSAFTDSVTVEVTLDAGTQATGSVGSGACTHEGNGYHTYAPAQAETNGDLAAFTFHGTGAVPVTVQIYTSFPQTGDNFARLGAPAGASIAADLVTIDDFLDTEIAAILAAVDTEVATIVTATGAAAIRAALGLASANLDTQLSTIDDFLDTEIAAIKAKSDLIPGTVDGKTFIAGWTLIMAALLGKASGMGTTTGIFRAVDDSKDRITATIDADGNRTALTLDAS